MSVSRRIPDGIDQDDRSSIVRSVIKALGLLEAIAAAQAGATLGELSKLNELHHSTTHRLVHTLIEAGYVWQDPRTRRYHLGGRAYKLASADRQRTAVETFAAPHLQGLADLLEETANLAVLEGTEVVYVSQATTPKTLRTLSLLGFHLPVYSTASGKALLAHLPSVEQVRLLSTLELTPQTPNTITRIDDLHVELDRIRRRGYAVDDEEQEIGVRGIAAPVSDNTGRPLAAISISGPSGRINVHRLAEMAGNVQTMAAAIEWDMGFMRK